MSSVGIVGITPYKALMIVVWCVVWCPNQSHTKTTYFLFQWKEIGSDQLMDYKLKCVFEQSHPLNNVSTNTNIVDS